MTLRKRIENALSEKRLGITEMNKALHFSKNAVYKFDLKSILYDNLKKIAFYTDKPLEYYDPDLKRSPSRISNKAASEQIRLLKELLNEKEKLIKRQDELIESLQSRLIEQKYTEKKH